MSESQKEIMRQALNGVTAALQAGVSPDFIMDRIIQRAMELGLVAGISKLS